MEVFKMTGSVLRWTEDCLFMRGSVVSKLDIIGRVVLN